MRLLYGPTVEKKNQTINNLSLTLKLVCAYNFDSLFRHNITPFLSHRPTLQPLPFKRGKISSREAEFCTEEYYFLGLFLPRTTKVKRRTLLLCQLIYIFYKFQRINSGIWMLSKDN